MRTHLCQVQETGTLFSYISLGEFRELDSGSPFVASIHRQPSRQCEIASHESLDVKLHAISMQGFLFIRDKRRSQWSVTS